MSYFILHNRALCETNDVLDYLYKEKVTFMEAVKLCASRGNLVRIVFKRSLFKKFKILNQNQKSLGKY